ncbi:hypothetical protein A3J90_03035 [candidate division WOR-1 bacterium RIFOXYC2_FULL_37_10]|uniref:RecF/RecN/SMC N-terminal domain-containing protein n=1 Tax=candidate division WOR-1 bacterium RIFOXYB2_FULL_37_13 TaxID=1802579 RepID=A0A1F4SVF9_UNCSA|nr:MAG: hypothetical protein A2246_03155 [candidate division WOR-1 bacterium RIFOXYA2_FULL_37_7]OGC24425.1 MAG: hypothetical protein A2310_08455 [candidate division WOR-1 bacterium RIFOXYB2_FULL_37_13]OGC37442.1 MAG: hypothetical protein A3J90_03035 [candidate division WOR-1 bacterium RIFOXYC2_FULL_37_10]
MHLKFLEIKGFKTFADGEKIIFDSSSGITAIVGPNGCGKSNVVDAFRFVLGEANIRSLRVNTAQEVIFAGTETRKSLSMAEVALTFDNSDKALPLDYNEVCVKRRTFRDGESKFLINGQSCRLKDIRDLFLDSGLSTESLSIISQGRVDAILSSKPEERRSVFEEVAGINKYRFRKSEAERKLILSEQNLLRIADIKIEIGEQLISLEHQAKSAKEYKEIQENVRQMELTAFKKQAKLLLTRREIIAEEVAVLRKLAEEREEERLKLKEEREGKQKILQQLEIELNQIFLNLEKIKDLIEEERGNLIIEKERHLFEEKNKVRDLKEEERFLSYAIKNVTDGLKTLYAKKQEIGDKRREASSVNLDEFGDFQEAVRLTVEISQKLKTILVDYFGKSWEELKEDVSVEKFRKLLDVESQGIEKEIAVQSEELKAKNTQLNNLAVDISAAENKLTELVKQTEDFEKTPLSEETSKLQAEKNSLEKQKNELKIRKDEIVNVLHELNNAAFDEVSGDGQSSDLLRKEVSLAKIETELAQIEKFVEEEYSLLFADLLSFDEEALGANKNKKEIEELKKKLRALEPVNLLAIDEFEKCKERHIFIETQHQDILLARENLKTLITELDIKAREDFQKAIGVIAGNFSSVFSELFEGGEAKIMMEEGKDALAAGIEISVRPNGRKWLNISLLSGGERSLTAIALLFAILKTSPSPLCILDEVDAALDDSNIARFTSYLKNFSQASQMLVITHSKRTMAVADSIYGITMEEPGISKVISMKLEKVG